MRTWAFSGDTLYRLRDGVVIAIGPMALWQRDARWWADAWRRAWEASRGAKTVEEYAEAQRVVWQQIHEEADADIESRMVEAP